MEFEDLQKIKMLRKLAECEEEDKLEWTIKRSVTADIHKKIMWAKYGWEMAQKEFTNLARDEGK